MQIMPAGLPRTGTVACRLPTLPVPAGIYDPATRGGTPRLHHPVVITSTQVFQPGSSFLGGTGFPACATRGGTPRLQRARQCRAPTAGTACGLPHCGGTSMRKPGMAARRGVWALARFLHRNQLPGEKEKNGLAGCPLRPLVPKLLMPNALRFVGKAFFSFSSASGTHGAQKRAKAHSPGLLQDHARVSFRLSSLGGSFLGGTGFPACATRGGTPRLQPKSGTGN